MHFPRSSGLLLHPTALPSPWGVGDLGPTAYQFVDFLAAAGQSLWQILPLGPTGYGDSPYQCFSAFAGNPVLISLDQLIQRGLLSYDEVVEASRRYDLNADQVHYGEVLAFKLPLLRHCYERLHEGGAPDMAAAFTQFCRDQHAWLDDYALFMTLKEVHDGRSWHEWEPELRTRDPKALAEARTQYAEAFTLQQFFQFLFFQQWLPLKAYANEHQIRIIGDAPIFVAYDSADVWANPELFFLDPEGKPTVVAGVPPDYFSTTGQLWGNPLYNWQRMAQDGYAWWIKRLRAAFMQMDILRLDHFRGFAAYWEVPAGEETAINGRWVKGPGAALFKRLEEEFGALPIIAEDLGLITPDVIALRDQFDLPGMKVLQFAFGGGSSNIYLPHHHVPNCVIYSGTHDNNTTVGWFEDLTEEEREVIRGYLGRSGSDIAWDFLRLAMMSVADMAVVPLQDVLRLDAKARINTPGRLGGNWGWRFRDDVLNAGLAHGLHFFTEIYGRLPPSPEPDEPAEDTATEDELVYDPVDLAATA
ncbi:4-alpha-glucanotransferase [Candidatus Chloroploca asiatica]|uniref:4-alpha-glucanotransferase n=1 Tax=Candidatus Chloroploca asiatica TaxID=1506545 RepID=A0A2H3LBD4_9CHLR|nr:4-alpha-glucanotransferase [Candidatus Chloroploca asiatica]PDV99723.1 4-alpha-glucanotransferase [Candidatus Chloroploca asiatica]